MNNLKKLKKLINEGYYCKAVDLAQTMPHMKAWFREEFNSPNECSYWNIRRYYADGSYCELLDAAHSSGLAGWFRLEGRWV